MITKQQAVESKIGDIFHHMTWKNSDRTPTRCRVMGKCKTLKTRPDEFKLPVKFGIYDSFYITHINAVHWEVPR